MLINDASITGSLIVNASASFQNISVGGNIIPDTTNIRNLGSTDKYFKEIYVSTGSINFVDGGSVVAVLSAGTITAIQSNTSSANSRLNAIESVSASLQSFTASISTTNTFTSSATARLNALETITSSNIARLNSIETITSSNIARLNAVETITASNVARLNSLETTSASVDTLNSTQNTRLTNLEIKTGSLATTGSNTFIGTQTITGSLFISSDLVVQGSSSLQNITASAVSIGTNIINLNTANPAIRYAGLSIGDSGSIGSSGSFLYDSVQDEMIFIHRGANTTVTSSVVLMGPQTFDNIGSETYPTLNIIQKGTGNEHLVDSCIFDNGTTVCIKNNLIGTGTISGTTIYGSTVVCSPVGKFTSCIDVSGSGTFSSTLKVGGATGNFLIDSYTTSKIGIRSWTDIAGTTNNFFLQNNASYNYGIVGVVSASGTATGDVYALGYSPSAGTSMTPVLNWTSGGSVGINTTNFGERLNIGCGSAIAWQNTCNCQKWHIQYNSADGLNFVESAVADFRLFLKAGGNIGVGTSNPSSLLHINGIGPTLKLTDCSTSGNGGDVYLKAEKTGVGYNNLTTVAFSYNFKGGGSETSFMNIGSTGISCFAGTVCTPFLVSTGGIQTHGTTKTIVVTKYFNERESGAPYFKLVNSSGNGFSAVIHSMSQNPGIGWTAAQIYHAVTAPYWGGWVGGTSQVNLIGSSSPYITSAAVSNNGCITFYVSTGNNGTNTSAPIVSYIQITSFEPSTVSATIL